MLHGSVSSPDRYPSTDPAPETFVVPTGGAGADAGPLSSGAPRPKPPPPAPWGPGAFMSADWRSFLAWCEERGADPLPADPRAAASD